MGATQGRDFDWIGDSIDVGFRFEPPPRPIYAWNSRGVAMRGGHQFSPPEFGRLSY